MITTRPARARDVEPITRLAQQAYRHYVERIGRRPAPMDAAYAAAVAAGAVWVAQDGHADGAETLGFVVLVDGDDHLLLDVVAVAPHAQGRGIGGVLLDLTERQARGRGVGRIRLYTNEAMTENLDYYPRRGYVETHRGEYDGFRRVHFEKTLDAGPRSTPDPAPGPGPA